MTNKYETNHLGTLIGSKKDNSIIAVSTSLVFEDNTLLKLFWNVENNSIDSGFQGHMYTKPGDVLVVYLPSIETDVLNITKECIHINHKIWNAFTGIQLSSSEDPLVVASHQLPQSIECPGNISLHKGSLIEAAINRYNNGKESLLAFVFNKEFFYLLEKSGIDDAFFKTRAETTSLLMDKNYAMQLLQQHNIDCPTTYFVNENTDVTDVLDQIPKTGKYIFKPSGGAAGIGVFGSNEEGVTIDSIKKHIAALKLKNKLPKCFQIQDFVEGTALGYSACINSDKSVEIFEIHQQFIDNAGRFIGGRWSQEIQQQHIGNATFLYTQMAKISNPELCGLICIDVINNKIIEVNPRLTAAAPIAHIFRKEKLISEFIGNKFSIKQIDINTAIQIPYEYIRNGKLYKLIADTWTEKQVLILPQGLNPFGKSRLLFINDNENGEAQKSFLCNLGN